ncbi:hypothetical protein RF11_01254 [Thelohanellus kitauei]|uniref:Uncharacterized protein n=1 Tax=Thelohanellus kitauei TaxID=669202 RepID=A0A0C2N5M7_THEKT|nr:hypothetical protein RF11_01254 [Thelohanellus kitauei]
MDMKNWVAWIPFIVFEFFCVLSCVVLITASRAGYVFGTRFFDGGNSAVYVSHEDLNDRSTYNNFIRINDPPAYSGNFNSIKETITIAACVAVFGTLCASLGRTHKKTRAASGMVLVITVPYLTEDHPEFSREQAAIRGYFPKVKAFHVYFLLWFTWPITIVFALYASFVLWECYKERLYYGIPDE